MRFTITINGESVTLQGVTDGATIDLTPQSIPTVPTVPEPTTVPTVDTVDDDDDTEPTPPTTVAPKGVGRSERKRPQSKSGPIKAKGADPIKRKGQSPLQAAGMAKTRHGRYGSEKTAQSWYDAEQAAGDAERIKLCKAALRDGFKVSKAGKVTAKG